MRYIWIYDGQVAGECAENVALESYPSGFTLVEAPDGMDAILTDLYWDGTNVIEKPSQPSPEHYWNAQSNEWELPIIPTQLAIANWQGLTSQLRGSAAWGHAYLSSEKTLKANSAFTLLLATLTSTHAIEDLVWALARLREAMQAIATGDFTTEELESIGQILDANGFDPEDFQLQP